MNKWCINSLSRVKSSCNYHIPFPPVTTAWSLTWMCMNQRSWMRKTASHVSWHKGSCREGSAKRDHQELSPLGTCSLGYCTRRLRMMSYGHHWHSNAGQQGGLLKKGWSLTRCVLGGGGKAGEEKRSSGYRLGVSAWMLKAIPWSQITHFSCVRNK